MPTVIVSCPVNPSEDPAKVRRAVESIFPDAEVSEEEGLLRGTAPSLDHFSKQIRRQRILDTARSVMLKGRRGRSRTVFHLSKQVAFVGKVSFSEERALLGPIRVEVEDPELDALIETVAPETVDGEEVRI